jgi:2-iminobutanoate/2-iminopropanoate deaminase
MKTVRFFPLILLLSLGSQAQSSTNVQYINPPNVPHPPGYTHAVIVPASKLVFLAGQVGLNSKGELVGKDDFRAQATQAFENIKAVLAAAGTTPDHLVRLNYYVAGLDDDKLKILREVRDKYVNTKEPPASTLVAVVRWHARSFRSRLKPWRRCRRNGLVTPDQSW